MIVMKEVLWQWWPIAQYATTDSHIIIDCVVYCSAWRPADIRKLRVCREPYGTPRWPGHSLVQGDHHRIAGLQQTQFERISTPKLAV